MAIRSRSSVSGPTTIGQKLFLSVFFSIFAVVGALLGVAMIAGAVAAIATYSWEPTPCTILSSEFNETEGVETGSIGWHVSYSYVVGGQTFSTTSIGDGLMDSRDTTDDRRLSQRYVPGTSAICYVNPRDPAEAILLRGKLAELLWVLLPLPFAAVGFGGLYFLWRRPRVVKDGSPFTPAVTSAAQARKPLWLIPVFFGVFLLVGSLGTWFLGVRPALQVLSARTWSEVPCTILSSDVQTHDSDDGYTYSVELVFKYEVNGRTYTSDRYQFAGGSSSGREGKEAIVARYAPESSTVCYVNPDDPTDAVIERGFTSDMAFGFIPLVFVLVGLGGIIGFLVHRSRARERARGGMPREQQRSFRAAVPAGSMTDATAATTGHPGAVVLETGKARVGKFVGLLIFGLIWNGIISIFVVSLFSGGWEGFSWFVALFLVPFVGVGLLVLGMAFHAGLAIFNPRPRLFLSSATLPPGERLELRWEMLGSVRRLRRFRIQLEGREEATYRRGTSTSTDKNVFARIELADVQSNVDMAAGSAVAQVPSDTMHSFTSSNNKIVWALHVRGEIPRWPDIDDEFPFTVLAQSAERAGVP